MPKSKRTLRAATNQPIIKHRPTEAELSQRVDTVYGLLISGTRRIAIVQYAAKTWGIADRQADEYIAIATALIKAENAKTREEAFAEHIAYRRKLRGLAESDKDWRAALSAAQDEAKLQDLYPAERRKYEFDNVSDEELARRANELAHRIIESGSGSETPQSVTASAGAGDKPAGEAATI